MLLRAYYLFSTLLCLQAAEAAVEGKMVLPATPCVDGDKKIATQADHISLVYDRRCKKWKNAHSSNTLCASSLKAK